MKKFIICLLSITLTVSTFSGCFSFSDLLNGSSTSSVEESTEGESTSEEKKVYYSIIFKQEGQDDIVKQVEAGKDLTDIPTPVQKTGYTTKWSTETFTAVSENMTVEAVVTANEYTITYDAGEGTVTPATQKVTYDTVPGSFATPTRTGYNFLCWTYEENAVSATDVWKTPSDVTFVAKWVEQEKCTVTFMQAGHQPIVIEVVEGESLAANQIPQTKPRAGYTVVWETKDLSSITSNIIVNAIATPCTYTITYDAAHGTVTPATQQVTFDTAPGSFATPTREGYKFKGWEYNGKVISATDIWTVASNVVLTAKWARITTVTLDLRGGETAQTTFVFVEGEAYSLPTPTKKGFTFITWKQGSTKIALNGTWTIKEGEVTLTADWIEEGWTKNY